jgi:hypothetical protein
MEDIVFFSEMKKGGDTEILRFGKMKKCLHTQIVQYRMARELLVICSISSEELVVMK